MKVLVTGGTGYIGSHTAVELMAAGFDVVLVDDLSNSTAEVVEGIAAIAGKTPDFYAVDVCNTLALEEVFDSVGGIGSAIHFAASKAVGESVENPLKYYSNNLVSLINLMEVMKKRGLGKIVFSSSCTVYGQPDCLPVTEQTPFQPAASPYGNTKQISEEILRDCCQAYPEFQAISLRYFNPVGAHDSAKIGELPLGVPNNLVPYITQTAAGLREELKVFGFDYGTPDGTAIRDYIHVVDLAEAHVTALQRLLEGGNTTAYEYFNIGAGKGVSVLEAVNAFQKVNQLTLNYRLVDRRPGDVESIYADISLAKSELRWNAKRDLSEMMRSAWVWQQQLSKA